jgi:soluble lytic murein transglycosylase-like protein
VSPALASAPAVPHVPPAIAAEFAAAGHAYGIPPAVLAAVAWQESGMGANRGPSSAGAVGLMQFEPATAHALGFDPRNDRASIWGAAKYLQQLGYGRDATHALAAYNAGPGNVAAGMGYAREVLAKQVRIAPQLGAGAGAAADSAPAGAFGPELLRLFLTGTLTAAGGVLAWIGARRALGGM